jgi:hypothetical protein
MDGHRRHSCKIQRTEKGGALCGAGAAVLGCVYSVRGSWCSGLSHVSLAEEGVREALKPSGEPRGKTLNADRRLRYINRLSPTERGRCTIPSASKSIEACGIFRTAKMSDASDSTVVLPDPIEPVMISSASVGAIAGLFLCTIITGAGIRKKACIGRLLRRINLVATRNGERLNHISLSRQHSGHKPSTTLAPHRLSSSPTPPTLQQRAGANVLPARHPNSPRTPTTEKPAGLPNALPRRFRAALTPHTTPPLHAREPVEGRFVILVPGQSEKVRLLCS